MSKERIETLTHQRQEKEEAIKVAREKIQQLQAQSKLKEEQSTVLTQANSALLDKAPTYLRDLDRAYTVKAPATTNEESDTQFIQQQIAAIDKQELRYKTQCKVDASTKLRDLLNKIDLLLKQNPNDFPESEIEQLVNEAAIAKMNLPNLNLGGSHWKMSMISYASELIPEFSLYSAPQSGFDLLLELLSEDSDDYDGFFTWNSTKNSQLSTALAKGISQLDVMISADEMEQRKFDAARNQLSADKIKLRENHQQKAQLSSERDDISLQVNELETSTLIELTDASALITKELESEQSKFELAQEEQLAHEQQEQRRLLAVTIKQMLSAYKTQRDEHYHTKDFLSSGDKKARDAFIAAIGGETEEIGGELDKYIASANSEDLRTTITKSMDLFPGVKMQATLNRIIVTLMDKEAGQQDDCSVVANQILSNLEEKHKNYVEQIRKVYASVDGIRTYANTLPEHEKQIINQLVDQLKKDIDQLISKSPEGIPSKAEYATFEMKFKARLHSQDDVMSEHKSWGTIIANVLLSVATLFKLIISKATTGRASFFFDKTEAQKEAEANVDQDLKELELTCSA